MSGTDRQIETQEIVCPGGMPAFLARPAAPGHYPVVVLIHERYGLVPHTRDLAKKCASDGFLVVAANYFYKHPDQKALNAGDDRYPMTDAEAIDYINASLEAIAKHAAADLSRVAVAGYCQTGRHPLVYASQAKISAAVVCRARTSTRSESEPTGTGPRTATPSKRPSNAGSAFVAATAAPVLAGIKLAAAARPRRKSLVLGASTSAWLDV